MEVRDSIYENRPDKLEIFSYFESDLFHLSEGMLVSLFNQG